MEIYEIQNKGKGVITSLVPNDLLRIRGESQDLNITVAVGDTTYSNKKIRMLNGSSSTNSSKEVRLDPSGIEITDENSILGEMGAGEYKSMLNEAYLIFKYQPTALDSGTTTLRPATITSGSNKVLYLPHKNGTLLVDTDINGSETKVNAGTNISVTGNGTITTPYIINNTLIVDGSETKLTNGITTTVNGNGTVATPYTVETVNLQKSITGDYTLTPSDNNFSIKADNGVTPITITIPTGLPENFFVGVTQKGDGDITLIGTGTTLNNPVGLKIKGKGYYVGIEQIGTSNVFDVLANTKL